MVASEAPVNSIGRFDCPATESSRLALLPALYNTAAAMSMRPTPALFADRVLTAEGWVKDARIEIAPDGQIVAIAPGTSPRAGEERFAILIPGMTNAHSHAFQRAFAGLAEQRGTGGDDFWSWRERMYTAALRMTPERMAAIALHLSIDLLRGGYTNLVEFHYLHHGEDDAPPLAMATALINSAAEAGIGFTLMPTLYQRSGFADEPLHPAQQRFSLTTEAFTKLIEQLAPFIAGHPGMSMGFAVHSLRAVDAATIRELAAYPPLPAPSPIHVHAAEQIKEVADCRAALGKPPIAWLCDNVGLSDRWTVIHAIHMSAEETTHLASSGATVAICPTAEANLGDGIFPLAHYLEGGGRIAIGSDAHMSVTPIDELRLLETGQRLAEHRRLVASSSHEPHTGARLWRSCAESGDRVTGQNLGTIAPGQRADLVALDPGDPMLAGKEDDFILDTLIFAADRTAISDVFVGGRHVVKAGHHLHAERARAGFISAVKGLFAS